MSEAKLRALRRGLPHHILHPVQKRLIAAALGVPVTDIWPDEEAGDVE